MPEPYILLQGVQRVLTAVEHGGSGTTDPGTAGGGQSGWFVPSFNNKAVGGNGKILKEIRNHA